MDYIIAIYECKIDGCGQRGLGKRIGSLDGLKENSTSETDRLPTGIDCSAVSWARKRFHLRLR